MADKRQEKRREEKLASRRKPAGSRLSPLGWFLPRFPSSPSHSPRPHQELVRSPHQQQQRDRASPSPLCLVPLPNRTRSFGIMRGNEASHQRLHSLLIFPLASSAFAEKVLRASAAPTQAASPSLLRGGAPSSRDSLVTFHRTHPWAAKISNNREARELARPLQG